MYEAIVCRLKNEKKHPNADRLKIFSASGYQIITGLDNKEGDLGVFFGPEGQLLPSHLRYNNLYAKAEMNSDPKKKGYFGKNGKVRAQKLRGEVSEGFWQEISGFDWAGPFPFKEGDTFSKINGHLICQKFISEATQREINRRNNKEKKNLFRRWKKMSLKKKLIKLFPYLWIGLSQFLKGNKKNDFHLFREHYDTKQLRHYLSKIPEGALCYVSYKLHGTSFRESRILTNKKHYGFFSKFKNLFTKPEYRYLSGSRRVVLDFDNNNKAEDGFYKGSNFREIVHNHIKEIGLHKGETLYGEIVGYDYPKLSPIMGTYNTDDKEIKKLYGKDVIFSYGCTPTDSNPLGNYFKIFIYRITMINESGDIVEYSWPQIKARCHTLGLEIVPEVTRLEFTNPDDFLKQIHPCLNGPDPLDNNHPREGLVVRVEDNRLWDCLKIKSEHFCLLEDIRNSNDLFVDEEDAS